MADSKNIENKADRGGKIKATPKAKTPPENIPEQHEQQDDVYVVIKDYMGIKEGTEFREKSKSIIDHMIKNGYWKKKE